MAQPKDTIYLYCSCQRHRVNWQEKGKLVDWDYRPVTIAHTLRGYSPTQKTADYRCRGCGREITVGY